MMVVKMMATTVLPKFHTYKYKISHLNSVMNVYDFQLRDHFINANNLYVMQCNCANHKHAKQRCSITEQRMCGKCRTPTKLFMTFQELMFHGEALINKKIYTCCKHTHRPPCNRCLNCNILAENDEADKITGKLKRKPCIVQEPFDCIHTTDVVCKHHPETFTKSTLAHGDAVLEEHIYSTKLPVFFFCTSHIHCHASNPSINCFIHAFKCCDMAISVKDYNSSFIVSLYNHSTVTRDSEFIIYDPTIWREQSFNHFISFLRAVILTPETAKERYMRFEDSNFAISNVKKYKSGKDSVVRIAVTGFETRGIYQTSTISCTIPYYKVLIPHALYNLLEKEGYDLSLVCVKRDPSIKTTCMFVCMVEKHGDPEHNSLTICDSMAKGLNQDQDGDKNAIYLLPKRCDSYNTTSSYSYILAKLELATAFRKMISLIGTPRYSISETNLMVIERNRNKLMDLIFTQRTIHHGPAFMIDAGCGYLRNEYEEFLERLMSYNKNPNHTYITADDLILKTNRLPSIVTSGAKGRHEHLNLLLNKISDNNTTLSDCEADMIELVNRYIKSSQDLSHNGRNQFASLYAATDLIIMNGKIFLNKVFICDYSPFASCGTFMWSDASLTLFTEDLLRL